MLKRFRKSAFSSCGFFKTVLKKNLPFLNITPGPSGIWVKLRGLTLIEYLPSITYVEIQPLEDRERRRENETVAQPIKPSNLIF
jgi:hypothetical protein